MFLNFTHYACFHPFLEYLGMFQNPLVIFNWSNQGHKSRGYGWYIYPHFLARRGWYIESSPHFFTNGTPKFSLYLTLISMLMTIFSFADFVSPIAQFYRASGAVAPGPMLITYIFVFILWLILWFGRASGGLSPGSLPGDLPCTTAYGWRQDFPDRGAGVPEGG